MINNMRQQWLMAAAFASLVLVVAFAAIPKSHGQECISIVAENNRNDNRFVQLHLSSAEGCVAVYALYVQIERNGSIQEITSTPSGWTYGMVEKEAAFWTTETEPVHSNSKFFGIELQSQKPHTLSWIALDETSSTIAKGILTM